MLHRAARPAYCASLPFPPPTPFLLVSPWACSAAILIRLPAPGDAKLPCDGLMSVPEAKMQNDRTLIYKIASEAREFEQIHALNYRTFVDEIPQHAPNGRAQLVDRLHHENTYVVCLDGERLAGMVALRAERPFSLDEKL